MKFRKGAGRAMKDPLFANKLAGAVLASLLLFFGLPQLAKALYGGEHGGGHEKGELKLAYPVAFETGAAPAAAAKAEADLGTLLASASPAAGERRAALCKSCHTFEKGGANSTGPNLWNIVGRPVASHEGFSYTAALKDFGGDWTYERLDKFLENSQALVPGTGMVQRFPKAEQRADILAFLQTLSDSPVPFPAPAAPASGEEGEDEEEHASLETPASAIDDQIAPYLENIEPVSAPADVSMQKAELGERLFNDTRLSADGAVSCATCHALATGGVDRLKVSTGIKGQNGPINAPTVYNAAHNFVQFWDGRAATLADQAAGPVENPLEMGEAWPDVVKKIAADGSYAPLFAQTYNGEISKATITDAIAEFERTLATPDSPFDKYLKGDKTALSDEAKRGFLLFNETGCTSCHTGSYFGGENYQKLADSYFAERGGPLTDADNGRFNVTGNEADRHVFKTPMLRNVAVTYPYFHDGSVSELDQAVKIMARHQLAAELSDADARAIAAFLQSLTGEYKGVPLDKMASR